MSAANVPMVIDQGEDWTTDIVWTDNFDEPVLVVHPCRMSIKNTLTGQTIIELETNPELPEGETPTIGLSSEMGLVQMHIDDVTTAALPPGQYMYDLFVTCGDEAIYPGLQSVRLIYGAVTVNKRVTSM